MYMKLEHKTSTGESCNGDIVKATKPNEQPFKLLVVVCEKCGCWFDKNNHKIGVWAKIQDIPICSRYGGLLMSDEVYDSEESKKENWRMNRCHVCARFTKLQDNVVLDLDVNHNKPRATVCRFCIRNTSPREIAKKLREVYNEHHKDMHSSNVNSIMILNP